MPTIIPPGAIIALVTAIAQIAAGVAIVLVVLHALPHLDPSQRNVRALAIDAISTVILIGVLFQANAIFTWLFGLFGITVALQPLPLLATLVLPAVRPQRPTAPVRGEERPHA